MRSVLASKSRAGAAEANRAGASQQGLSGIDDAQLRPDASAPPGIGVENLRRRGIDRLRLALAPPPVRGALARLLGLGAKPAAAQTLVIADRTIHVETGVPGKKESRSVAIPFAAVKSVSLRSRPITGPCLVLAHGEEQLDLGAGLDDDALVWLRDRLLLEIAGLVWKPVFNVGRRTTRKVSTAEDDTFLEWSGRSNRLIESFLSEAPGKAAALGAAIADGNWGSARQAVHWLKSSCASVGAAQLSDLCQRMEIEIDINDLARMRVLGASFEAEFGRVTGTLAGLIEAASETQVPKEPTATDPSFAAEAQRLAGIRVLLVEDSKVNQELAREYLTEAGAEVMLASDGTAALACLETSRFDVVFMDCQMDGLDGYETTRLIREREIQRLLAPTPIIALTAHALRDDRAHCLSSGMSDYLSKPYTQGEIIGMAEAWGRAAVVDVSGFAEDDAVVTDEEGEPVRLAEPAE